MPNKPKRPCKGRFNTCPNVVDAGQKYCPSCQPKEAQREKQKAKEYDRQRGTAQERGYDARWNKVSALYKKHHPLCEMCEGEGKLNAAEEVHHKIPIKKGGSKYSFDNLMSLCRACHNKIEPRFN